MLCENCATLVKDDQTICPICGNRLNADPPVKSKGFASSKEPPAPSNRLFASDNQPSAPGKKSSASSNRLFASAGFDDLQTDDPDDSDDFDDSQLTIGDLLEKLRDMEERAKAIYLGFGALLLLCLGLSMFRVFSVADSLSAPMTAGGIFFANLFTILFTLCITFYIMDYLDIFSFEFLWYFMIGSAGLILLVFVIMWISSGLRLSISGWLFLLAQAALTALAVLNMREQQ